MWLLFVAFSHNETLHPSAVASQETSSEAVLGRDQNV